LSSEILLSQTRISLHFMEPEGSLPCSQEAITCWTPETDESSSYPYIHSFKINLRTDKMQLPDTL
jgi:hypothetical protein